MKPNADDELKNKIIYTKLSDKNAPYSLENLGYNPKKDYGKILGYNPKKNSGTHDSINRKKHKKNHNVFPDKDTEFSLEDLDIDSLKLSKKNSSIYDDCK